MKEVKFTEKQLAIIEAALRYSIDQVESSEIRVLDWGDGANQQFSEKAYIVVGDVTVDEGQMIEETKALLEDSLSMLQHIRDSMPQ